MALDPLSPMQGRECGFPLSFHPQFQIVGVGRNGIVIRCSRAFEWGSTIELGVHVHLNLPAAPFERPNEADGLHEADALVSDSFVDFKGIVVDCRQLEPVSVARPVPLYEITLFYDSITHEQCAALLLASRQRADLNVPSAPAGLSDPFGFDRIRGLN